MSQITAHHSSVSLTSVVIQMLSSKASSSVLF